MTKEEAIQYIDGLHVVPCEQLKEFCDERNEAIDMAIEALSVANLKEEFESADATPTVIRAKTFMGKEDFDKWAENIKKQNKSIVCIPCDAEVISADAVVRCKDCRFAMVRTEEEMNKPIKPQPILCEWFCIGVENDGYCSHGERRK